MTSPAGLPNWDLERGNAPERPRLPAGISSESRIDRPKRVAVARLLAFVGLMCFIAALVISALHLEEIRDSFIAVLNESLEEDYSEDDKESAVNILLALIGGIAFLFALSIAIATNAVASSKSSGARIAIIVLIVLYLPAAFLAATLRENNWLELTLSVTAALCFIIAAVLLQFRNVSKWLAQSDRLPPTPLTAYRDATPPPRGPAPQ